MEVRPGYKRTEVGLIPEDWEIAQVSDIASVKTGPFGSALHQSDYVQEGTPIITVEHLSELGVVHSDLPKVSDFDRDRLESYSLQENDIVFSRVGSVDRNSLISAQEDGWLFSGRLLRIRAKDEKVFFPYLSFYFHYEPFKQRVRSVAVGQTMPSLNTQIMKNLVVVLPPLSEQRAIAEVLSDVDELIAALDRLIAKKRAIKQGAMQQLLTGKTRLPGFSGSWDIKRLDNVAEIYNGGTPSTNQSEFWDGDVVWCTPTDVTALDGFKYLSRTARTITALGLKASSAELIPAHSIVMTSRATIGECAINTVPVATNQGFKSLVPFQDADVEFLYYLLQTKKRDFLSMCSGSTFPEISKSQVAAFEIELPAKKTEQSAIAAVLSDMDAEIAALEARRDKTRALKQGMMQELLTGRTRLV
jgi:type I restriction enzyme S subunit